MIRSINALRYFAALAGLAAGAALIAISLGSSQAVAEKPITAPPAIFEAPATTRTFADIVEQVSPAVVNITVTKPAEAVPAAVFSDRPNGNWRPPFDDFFERFFDLPGIPQMNRQVQALGSGFLVDSSGYVVTNNHVIDGASKIVVKLQGGREVDATLVGTDPKTDLALLKIDAGDQLPALRFGDSDKARVGEWVLAIGNPFGLGGTATAGIISARGRDIRSGPYDDYLQIDAPINSGNSGGPVFNANGEVIGVNTAIFSPNGGNVGIGFAIPSKQAMAVVDQLKSSGTVRRGWLGIQIQDVDDDIANSFDLRDASGALVAEVIKDSPADKAGLQVGDVIVQFDHQKIDTAKALSHAVAAADPNDKVPVKVWRNGSEKTLRVKLGESEERSQSTPLAQSQTALEHGLGLTLADLNDDYRSRLGLPQDFAGVVVTRVQPGSSADEKEIRPGDVIARIDMTEIRNVNDAARAIKAAKEHGGHASLLVRRGDGQRFVSVAIS